MFSADTLQQALVQDYGRLCTLANKILQDSHLAQDAVQESWLRLNRARPRYDRCGKAAPFAAGHGAPAQPPRPAKAETITGIGGPDLMKEPLDELLVQACAAQQRADLAALEQLEPANVPMPFVPQVRRTPRRLLKAAMIAAVCAALVTTVYAFWPEVAVILEGSRAYLAVQEAPQNSIPMEQMQLTYVPEGCTVAWDDSTYQKYGVYYCLIDNGKQGREQQLLGIAQMPLENKVNIQGRGPDDAITEEDEENIAQQFVLVDDIAALTAEEIQERSVVTWAAGDSYYVASVHHWQDKDELVKILQGIR